jgi:hypothetical protein
VSASAIIVTRYGELRSFLDRTGELEFVGADLRVAGVAVKPRVTVEIGPDGPRPLLTSTGAEVGPEIPHREFAPLAAALVAAVRAWVDGPDTDAVVLDSVRTQLRTMAVRHDRLRHGAEILGVPPTGAIPEFYRVRWAGLLAEYARRTLDDRAALELAVGLVDHWSGTGDQLLAAATDLAARAARQGSGR